MATLKKITYPASSFTSDNTFPHLFTEKAPLRMKSSVEGEGLRLDYGRRESSYPYTQQNSYSAEAKREINVAVLENDYLYAEFLPDFGGRLWRLFDKKKQKDILYTNDVIRFRNLSTRNAWFSGGVEWNCGIMGHSPFTCSPMYCAFVRGKAGEDVVRFYEFERVRGIYYQIDFWLEENRLLTAVRIENPNSEEVPMYWWSTMASPEFKGGRVVVPSDEAYCNYGGTGLNKTKIPFDRGVDASYPENLQDMTEYFYNIPSNEEKFIANIDEDGFGLLEFSTPNLSGRKLFSWGHRKGSLHWQKMLTYKAGSYVEIQAGLTKTQYECTPMPSKSVWTFSECYTLCNIPAQKVKAPYGELVSAVNEQIKSFGGGKKLEGRLPQITESISLIKGETVLKGSGFGYLNTLLGGSAPKHLEFFPADDVKDWISLLKGDGNIELFSFACGERMEKLLLKNQDAENWNISYQLSLLAYDRRDFQRAEKWCRKSLNIQSTAENNHLMSHILYHTGNGNSVLYGKKAVKADKGNFSLAESIFSLLLKEKEYGTVIDLFSELSTELQKNPRLLMYLASAHSHSGNARTAEEILTKDGGLELFDFREGDRSLDALYRSIRKALYNEKDGDITVPEDLDFTVI